MASLLIEAPQRRAVPAARPQCYFGVALLLLLDALLKAALRALHFPSALVGMALIVAALTSARRWRPAAAAAAQRFFDPAVRWVAHKWLPCFYAPALVTLPLALRPLPAPALAKAAAVVTIGVALTAACTSQLAMGIRRWTGIEAEPVPHDPHGVVTFTRGNYALWGGAGVLALCTLLLGPAHLHPLAASLLMLASTLLGYMAGMALPAAVQRACHPIVVCAAAPNAAVALVSALTGQPYWSVLQQYLTKGAGGVYGSGDLLFAFLGVIILCFGFKIYEQWDVLLRHAPEILGAALGSAAFSMLSTAALARAAALPPELARGLVPRGATLALALPIADALGAPPQLTAASVALTGIVGANLIQALLSALGAKDAVTRGLTAAATAHGLGTAAIAAREPEALPFAALGYALCGVAASLLAAVPAFRAALLAITG